jgi:hypothetical protein
MIRSLDVAALRATLPGLLAAPPADMRVALTEWARKAGVELV